jgi:hypothetical protein
MRIIILQGLWFGARENYGHRMMFSKRWWEILVGCLKGRGRSFTVEV